MLLRARVPRGEEGNFAKMNSFFVFSLDRNLMPFLLVDDYVGLFRDNYSKGKSEELSLLSRLEGNLPSLANKKKVKIRFRNNASIERIRPLYKCFLFSMW